MAARANIAVLSSHWSQSKAATERIPGSIDNYVTGVNEGSQRRYGGKGKQRGFIEPLASEQGGN